MKSFSSNLSLPNISKITSQFLQDLIKEKKKLPFINTNVNRKTYKQTKQITKIQRTNRHSDPTFRLDTKQFLKSQSSEHLNIKSPFYKRIDIKHIGKCQCKHHNANKNVEYPSINKNICTYHQQFISQKVNESKKFHKNMIDNIKQGHTKNHEQIQKNNTEYLSYSVDKSTKIKEQKAIFAQRNRSEFKAKLDKTINQSKMKKQFKKVFFKQKLNQIYNLDNQNQPFDKILEKRNKWQRQKHIWMTKILKHIHKQIKDIKQVKQKFQKSGQVRLLNIQIQKQRNLLDIEKCLLVILKNISSINDLTLKNQKKNFSQIIQQTFKQSLNIETSLYPKKLRTKLGQIVQNVLIEQTKFNEDENKQNNNLSNLEEQLKSKQISQKNVQIKINQPNQTKQPFITAPQQKSSHHPSQKSIPNLSTLSLAVQQNTTDQKDDISKKYSILSSKSNKSIASKKLSTLSKASFMSNIGGNLTKRKQSIETQEKQKDKTQRSNVSLSHLSKSSSKAVIDGLNLDKVQSLNVKKSMNCSLNVTPSLSKQVISQKQQLAMSSDEQEYQQNTDEDSEEQYQTIKAIRFAQAVQCADEQQRLQQMQRIDGVIDFLKQRIRSKKTNTIVIPVKYQHINYEKFCSQTTFRYVTSMIDDFQGQKKFRFLYNQLQIKKKILDDQYIKQLVKQFGSMFSEEQQVQEWKQYLFQHRSKVMFEKLNRMIESGMKQININKADPTLEIKDQTSEPEIPRQCEIFNAIDESQLSYERYLQKLQRKKQQQRKRVGLIQQDLNIKLNNTDIQVITQKSIPDNVQPSSTTTIHYSHVDHVRSKNQTQRNMNQKYDQDKKIEMDANNKKQILKYLLKKKPQQFELLNKDVSLFAQFVKNSFKKQSD